MKIWSEELGPFATNCYIVACEKTRACAIIDPGQDDPWISRTVSDNGLKPEVLLLTHAHVDHIGGVAWVKEKYNIPVWMHPDDVAMMSDPRLNGSALFPPTIIAPAPDRLLRSKETFQLGEISFQVLHTPGHTPGGISFYTKGHLIAGDTLFAGSIGRTDLPGGDHSTLIKSIKTKLMALPDDTMVYPGHGPDTTIGDERQYNPFLR